MPQTRVLMTENHGSERSARAFNMALQVRLTWLCTCVYHGSAQSARAIYKALHNSHVHLTWLFKPSTCIQQASAQPARALNMALPSLHVHFTRLCSPYTCLKHGSARPPRAFNINLPNQRASVGKRNCSNRTLANPSRTRRKKIKILLHWCRFKFPKPAFYKFGSP